MSGVKILFVGINPSLYSAAVGHHFARPGNRFFPALFASGITPRRLTGFQDRELLQSDCGITNICDAATARADEILADELSRGLEKLIRKIRRFRPEHAVFLGMTAYRTAFGCKEVRLGRQNEKLAGATLWVLPNPSGLNAHYQLEAFSRLFADLRDAVWSEGATSTPPPS